MYSKEFLESLGLDSDVFDPDPSPRSSAVNKSTPGTDLDSRDENSDPSLICAF